MIKVDISGIWGEVSLPDLLKMEYDIFQAHLALEEGTDVAEFDVRSYNNPVWLYAACRVLMAGCGKKRELLTIFDPALEPLARQWQEWFRNLKTELTWAHFPVEVPENAFVTLLHRAEAAAEGAAEDLTGRDIPVVSIVWDGTEGEVEAFFRLAGALAGQLEQKT